MATGVKSKNNWAKVVNKTANRGAKPRDTKKVTVIENKSHRQLARLLFFFRSAFCGNHVYTGSACVVKHTSSVSWGFQYLRLCLPCYYDIHSRCCNI